MPPPIKLTLALPADTGQLSALASAGRAAAAELASLSGESRRDGSEWLALWEAANAAATNAEAASTEAASAASAASAAATSAAATNAAVAAAECLQKAAYERLHKGRWDEVHSAWRTAYACGSMLSAAVHARAGDDVRALRVLDIGLMMGGTAAVTGLDAAAMVDALVQRIRSRRSPQRSAANQTSSTGQGAESATSRPQAKRRKRAHAGSANGPSPLCFQHWERL